jgi:head-tail adaptor
MQPAGKLDQRVRIDQKAVARNSIGEETETWSTFATVWAQWIPVRVSERVAGSQLQAETEGRLRMRWLPGLTSEMRLVWRGENYDLAGPPLPVEGRGRMVDVFVVRGVRDGR